MTRLGEQHDDLTVVTISLATEAERRKAEKILPLLGWKISSKQGDYSVEPGDSPTDVLCQAIPGALGIDEISMEETVAAGRKFSFEIASKPPAWTTRPSGTV